MARRAGKFFEHVSVITTDPSRHLRHIQKTADGLTIHRIRSFAPSENYHFPSPIELFAQLKESRPQVLHIHALHDLPGPVAGFMDSQSSLIFTPHYVGRINSRLGRGRFKPELWKLAASLKVNGGVEWLEGLTRDELFELYSSATAVIVPSESESMGVAAAEAIGVGAPTIVADASGLAEFVEEGLAQPIEPPVTYVKLAQKIEEVLEDPKRFSPTGMKSPLIKTWDEVAEQTYRSCAS